MTTKSAGLLRWSPRALGILMSVFLALFALDAFTEGNDLTESLSVFAIHLTPALVLAVVAASWQWEWLGGIVFIALAIAYATMAGGRTDWILVISAPMFVIGALFLWSWRHHEDLHSRRSVS